MMFEDDQVVWLSLDYLYNYLPLSQGCAADPELSPPTTPSLITSVDLPNTDLDQHNENIPNNEAPTTSLETTLNDRELEPFNS